MARAIAPMPGPTVCTAQSCVSFRACPHSCPQVREPGSLRPGAARRPGHHPTTRRSASVSLEPSGSRKGVSSLELLTQGFRCSGASRQQTSCSDERRARDHPCSSPAHGTAVPGLGQARVCSQTRGNPPRSGPRAEWGRPTGGRKDGPGLVGGRTSSPGRAQGSGPSFPPEPPCFLRAPSTPGSGSLLSPVVPSPALQKNTCLGWNLPPNTCTRVCA